MATIENLVPRSTYDSDQTGYWKRLPILAGVFFGLFFGAGMAVFMQFPGFSLGRRIVMGICIGLVGGVAFGVLFPRRFRRRMSALTDAVYLGKPEIEVPPPSDRALRYRLPCSWLRTDNFGVGGVLYLGSDGLLFVPHRKNLERDRSLIEMGPLRQLNLALTASPPNPLFKLLVPHPTPKLQVSWPSGAARFLIPAPHQLLPIIQGRLKEIASGASNY